MKRTRYFQWVDGELSGVISTLVNITSIDGEYFYNFTDGESCNLRYISKMTNNPSDLKGKVMVEIASPNDPWVADIISTKTFKNAGTDEIVDIPPLEDITSQSTSGTGQTLNIEKSVLGTKKFKAPKFNGPFSELPSLDDYYMNESLVETINTDKVSKYTEVAEAPVAEAPVSKKKEIDTIGVTEVSETKSAEVKPKDIPTQAIYNSAASVHTDSPIEILAKTCKKHSTDINLTITMDLPSKAIYKMVSEEFENGGTAFIDSLISNLDVNDVIDSIRTALILAYSKNED